MSETNRDEARGAARERRRIDSLVRTAREELMRFVDRLRNGRDTEEHRLFSILTDMASDLAIQPDRWLESVFHPNEGEYRSHFLYDHSINVAILSLSLGREMSVTGKDLLILGAGGLLHDVGMFDLPEDLLRVGREFTEEERKVVQTHPERGAQLLQDSRLKKAFSRLSLQEQEREDGSGYPHRLRGEEIEHLAKIVGFCDSVESVTHFRPHRAPRSFFDGFSLLLGQSRDQFPRHLWLAALRRITPYPPGSLVKLSSGKLARVHKPNPETPMKPVVELLEHEDGAGTEHLLDLRRYPMITIGEALA